MVFNDGNKWLSAHFAYLDQRFRLRGHLTELFVVDPDGPFLSLLAQKTGDSKDRDKIEHSIKNIRKQFDRSSKEGILKIYYMPLFPTHTVFLSDKQGIVTLYTISSGREPVPIFDVASNESSRSIFEFLKRDVDQLRDSSKLVFDSNESSFSTP